MYTFVCTSVRCTYTIYIWRAFGSLFIYIAAIHINNRFIFVFIFFLILINMQDKGHRLKRYCSIFLPNSSWPWNCARYILLYTFTACFSRIHYINYITIYADIVWTFNYGSAPTNVHIVYIGTNIADDTTLWKVKRRYFKLVCSICY